MKPKQSIPKNLRYTVADFNVEFPTDDACLEYVKERRWPNGVADCSKCGVERKHYRVTGRTAYACDHCGNHIYPLAGTVFEKSTTSLKTWFYAMYLMGSTRCGISAKQIQRETGVTYKTAWRIFRQIRTLLSEDVQLEGSTVEMDETFHGGTRRTHFWRDNKVPIVGMVERSTNKRIGRVVARVAPDVKKQTLRKIAKEYILPKSTVFTDEHVGYDGFHYCGWAHKRIRHTAKVYVQGEVHTNTIEGFWSTVKRGIGGVYHNVSAKYLQTYLDEYCFRYNRRDRGNLLFKLILDQVSRRAS
ncbi:MAG TPA: IS1595 family transposase [Candidatus Acidoferrum sp.]|nr:IS1595 family transposase [Candidatus Acidoferrum sp.]